MDDNMNTNIITHMDTEAHPDTNTSTHTHICGVSVVCQQLCTLLNEKHSI